MCVCHYNYIIITCDKALQCACIYIWHRWSAHNFSRWKMLLLTTRTDNKSYHQPVYRLKFLERITKTRTHSNLIYKCILEGAMDLIKLNLRTIYYLNCTKLYWRATTPDDETKKSKQTNKQNRRRAQHKTETFTTQMHLKMCFILPGKMARHAKFSTCKN